MPRARLSGRRQGSPETCLARGLHSGTNRGSFLFGGRGPLVGMRVIMQIDKVESRRDDKVEEILQSHDVDWEVIEIAFSEIDIDASRKNGARQGVPLNEKVVQTYRENIEAGHVFPMMVVTKIPTGYLLHAGNQRSEVHRRRIMDGESPKDMPIKVYLVKTTSALVLHDLERRTNIGTGWGESREGVLSNALYLVSQDGMSLEDAAKLYGMSRSRLQTAKRQREKRIEYGKRGIDTSRLSQSAVLAVGSANDVETEGKLAHLANSFAATANTIQPVATAVRKASSAAQRIRLIKEAETKWKNEARDKKGGQTYADGRKLVRRPRKAKALKLLGDLARWLESGNNGGRFDNLDDMQVFEEETKKEVINLWGRVRAAMNRAVRNE